MSSVVSLVSATPLVVVAAKDAVPIVMLTAAQAATIPILFNRLFFIFISSLSFVYQGVVCSLLCLHDTIHPVNESVKRNGFFKTFDYFLFPARILVLRKLRML